MENICSECRKSTDCKRKPRTDQRTVAGCSWFEADTVITNADRIRGMTDEELDKFLGEVQWDVANYCGGVTQKQTYPVPEHRGAWLDWLKAPVEEVDDGT